LSQRFLIQRLFALVPVVFGTGTLVFVLIRMIPGDVVTLLLETSLALTPDQLLELKAMYGLDRPVFSQFVGWWASVLQGNLGVSFRTGLPVLGQILYTLPVTLELTLLAFIFSIAAGLAAGTVCAIKQNSKLDIGIRVFNVLGLSIPAFWLGIILILCLVYAGIYKVGYVSITADPIKNLMVMTPAAIVLGIDLTSLISRMNRASLLDVLRQDYIRTARAKGLPERLVLLKHALKNSLIPVVTLAGNEFGRLLGGAIIVEEVFSIPGVGRLLLRATYDRDYPLIQGIILVTAVSFVLLNLLVDLLYTYLDPRIRY